MGSFIPTIFVIAMGAGVLLWSINWKKDSIDSLCYSFYTTELEYIRKMGKRLPELPNFYNEWLRKTKTNEAVPVPLIMKIDRELMEYREWQDAINKAKN